MGGGVGEAEVPVSPVRTRVMLTRLCAGWWRRRPHCHCPSQAFIGPALDARTASGWSPSPPSGPAFLPTAARAAALKCGRTRRAWVLPGLSVTPVALSQQPKLSSTACKLLTPQRPLRPVRPGTPCASVPTNHWRLRLVSLCLECPLCPVCVPCLHYKILPSLLPRPPPHPPKKTDVHLLGHRLLYRRSLIVPSWCLIQT